MDLDILWRKSVDIFPILEQKLVSDTKVTSEEFQQVISELSRYDIAENVYETVLNEMDMKLRHETVPNFWTFFKRNESDCATKFFQFQDAVNDLHLNYLKFKDLLIRLSMLKGLCRFKNVQHQNQDEVTAFNDILKVALLSQLPPNFETFIHSFYQTSFKVFVNSHLEVLDDEECSIDLEIKCNGCDNATEECICQALVCAFNNTNQYLSNMSLLDRLSGFTLTNLIQARITSHVQETCEGMFDISHIANLEKWLDIIVLNWLTRIFNQGTLKISPNNSHITSIIAEFKVKLGYYLLETYANAIIDQFFSIIIDFPESQPAIDDLKLCLEKLDLRQRLVKSLTFSLETRLLHPGVNTADILSGYIAAIKAIRHLDSSGVLLETITDLVKKYMRSRSDTVKCVVKLLTDEGELTEELAKSEATSEDPANKVDEMTNWESWKPDPKDINPTKLNRRSRSADIISMVVDIYGSKEMFVSEYRTLLAERLLNQLDFNPEKEIRNLELLKLRFEETLLHTCEVMLKDISDSKRINSYIHNESEYDHENSFKISSMILSSQFWPEFKNDICELPSVYKTEFDKYTKSFEAYKVNRTLNWRHHIGRVSIEVELANRTLEFIVNPMHAAILHYFQDKNRWSLEELCAEMKVQPTVMRKRISFWQAQGIIKEIEIHIYELIDDLPGLVTEEMQSQREECEDDEASSIRSASDQREEELQVFWSYIVGMLTNLDSLPLERIHQMLKMFASHAPGVEFSQDELKNFLQRKVREHKLIFSGAVYHLPK